MSGDIELYIQQLGSGMSASINGLGNDIGKLQEVIIDSTNVTAKNLGFVQSAINAILPCIDELKEEIADSNEASSKLSNSANKLTRALVLVGAAGVLISLAHLAFNIYKFIQA